jgi:hypothetical protein
MDDDEALQTLSRAAEDLINAFVGQKRAEDAPPVSTEAVDEAVRAVSEGIDLSTPDLMEQARRRLIGRVMIEWWMEQGRNYPFEDPARGLELVEFIERESGLPAPMWEAVTEEQRGLEGDRPEPCVVCDRPTDTALAFEGTAEWAAAGLVALGLEMDVAVVTLSVASGFEPGKAPTGTRWYGFRVCGECASRADLEVGSLDRGIPTYQEEPD